MCKDRGGTGISDFRFLIANFGLLSASTCHSIFISRKGAKIRKERNKYLGLLNLNLASLREK